MRTAYSCLRQPFTSGRVARGFRGKTVVRTRQRKGRSRGDPTERRQRLTGGIPDIHAIAPVDELMTHHASRQGAEPNRIVLSADELRIQGYLRMGTCGTQSE
jgi:hypothetical protein